MMLYKMANIHLNTLISSILRYNHFSASSVEDDNNDVKNWLYNPLSNWFTIAF